MCSDEGCAELFEAYGSLAELEALACDCGCTLEILTLDEAEGAQHGFDLVPLA